MGNLFTSTSSKGSKAKGPAITDVDRAILSLKTQRKKLEDQQKLLEQRCEHYTNVARELIHEKKKDRALVVLKRKKLAEKQVQQLMGLQLNVEDMLSNIETNKQQNKLFTVLQQGNDALKQLQSQVKLEDVQKLMDDTADAKAYMDEMNSLLAQSLTDVDSEAVGDELEALEAAVLDEEMASMPKVPVTKVAAVEAARAAAQEAQQQEEREEEAAEQQQQRTKLEPLPAS